MTSSNLDKISNISVRLAAPEDEAFILSLVPRLVEFGPPAWRDAEQMTATDRRILSEKLREKPEGTAIFVAEDDGGAPLGFIHLQAGRDYYNPEPHGHISDVIVAPSAKGRGVGAILLAEAEKWARAQGFRWLTLSVFAQNEGARAVYERLGYGEDIVKYVKELD